MCLRKPISIQWNGIEWKQIHSFIAAGVEALCINVYEAYTLATHSV